MTSPQPQVLAADAWQQPFNLLHDLLSSESSNPFILPVDENDGRAALTFAQLKRFTDSSLALLFRYAPPGARVAASLPNGPEIACLYFAITARGLRSLAPLNPDLALAEVTFELTDVPATVLIVPPGRDCIAADAAASLGLPCLELQPDAISCGLFQLAVRDEVNGNADGPAAASQGAIGGREAAALIIHTSGTTRKPKVVPLTHGHLGTGCLCVVSTLGLSASTLCLNVMPLFHLHGLMVNLLASAVGGAGIICAPGFRDAKHFFRWLQPYALPSESSVATSDITDEAVQRLTRSAPNWYSAVPTIHLEVLRLAEQSRLSGGATPAHSLTLVRNCSAALAPSIASRLEDALPGVVVLPTYAMTEALPICSNPLLGGTRNLSSVGPAAGPEVACMEPAMSAVTVPGAAVGGGGGGESESTSPSEGEVVVRGRCVFGGYEQRSHFGFDVNAAAFAPGGWLRTGDMGRLDASGHLFLTGRFKEIINRAGEKASPLTIEHVLLAACAASVKHHGGVSDGDEDEADEDGFDGVGGQRAVGELHGWVRELLAFAAPHEELGEVTGVVVVCEQGKTVTLTQVRRAGTRGGLSRKWLPELLVIMPSLPKGPTGKPARINLAETHELPTLSLKASMRTMDLRGGQPKDFEAARRAAARKAAAQRAEARKQHPSKGGGGEDGRGEGVEALPPAPLTSMDGCIALVVEAMAEASGENVGRDDDLFDAGLSSISAARLREILDERAGRSLPHELVYSHPTVRSLAAAICGILRAAGGGAGGAAEGGTAGGGMGGGEQEDAGAPILLVEAAACYRDGALPQAQSLCLRAAALMGLAQVLGDEGSAPSDEVLASEDAAPMLTQIMAVWSRLQRWREAARACRLLLALRRRASDTHPADVSLLLMQLAKLCHAAGDAAEADAAVAAASDADPAIAMAHRGSAAPSAAEPLGPPVLSATIETLVLTRQGLTALPACVMELTQLRVLDASENALCSLGMAGAAAGWHELRELLLSSNELVDLPSWLADLPHLAVLNVQANRLAALPHVVLRCAALRHLRWGLQKTEVVAAPSDASRADADAAGFASPHLTVLELEGNGQTALAPLAAHNTVLTALLASFNTLRAAPAHLGRYGASLKRLHLGGNEIRSLDGVLPPLSSLTCLCVEGNRLAALPDEIGALANLRELWAYGNELTALPAALGKCAALTKLEAGHNRLADLPDALAALTKLKTVYLQSNRLRGLASLHERILRHLPLLNLGLGCNELELCEAVEMPGVRVGLAWNGGEPPAAMRGVLTDRLATVDYLYDPMCQGHRADVLLVAFAAQGAGMQQWVAPCSATRAAGVAVDALYLADPSNSYYLQDPARGWDGVRHYEGLVRSHAQHYARVLMVGSSMGGTAALMHAHLADRVLSFGPKLDLWRCHGAYLPDAAKRACTSALSRSLRDGGKGGGDRATTCAIHVGSGNLEDVLQAARVRDVAGVEVIAHATFHHNVPMYLEREGVLVALFKRELAALLAPRAKPAASDAAQPAKAAGSDSAEPAKAGEQPPALDLARAAAILQSAGRPKLLAWLKEQGLAKLSERQAAANKVAKGLKDGSLAPAALADDDAALLSDAPSRLLRFAEAGDEAALRTALTATDCPSAAQQRAAKGSTALMAAAAHGRESAVALLLQPEFAAAAGVDEARAQDGCTAVMLAIKAGHAACLLPLLAARANPDATNQDGWSALMLACERNAPEAVGALLAAGAAPAQGLHNGWAVVLTPLKLACIGGHAGCVKLLLEGRAALNDDDGSRLDIVEADGSTMLLYAAQRTRCREPAPDDGHVRTVKLLLEANAPPDQSRWDGLTPLAYASTYGDADSAALLLAHGAQPSRRDEAGWTPLLWAALRGHAACVRLLLEASVPPGEARPNGCTALMAAASTGSDECVDELLRARAAVGDRMSRGRGLSALMVAARHGHESCVKRLLAAGASLAETDALGCTALQLAEREGHAAVADLLRGDGESQGTRVDAGAEPPSRHGRRFVPVEGMSHLDSWQERAGRRWAGAAGAARRQYFVSSSHPHFANLVQLILWEHGFSRAEKPDAGWELMWHAGQVDPLILRHLTPAQRINKFPNSGCLTTKSQLWSTFARMQRRHGAQHFGFVPTTFELPTQLDALHAVMKDDVASARHDADEDGAASVWIVKPVAACRGQGITLHRSADGLPPETGGRRAVASRYVHPPYLVEGRKVDLRLYVLVTSWRPLVMYLHPAGLTRLATASYALADLGNSGRHLTNYSINKYEVKKGAAEDAESKTEIKLTLEAFRARLAADVGEEAAAAAWRAVDDALIKTCIAAEPQLGQAVETYVPRDGGRCFQIFGFDVMLDAQLRPWVIEVNLDPSLATDAPVDFEVKGAVITDLLNLLGVGEESPAHDADATRDAPAGLSTTEAEVVHRVDTEYRRSLQGGWRRLHPSKLSAEGAYTPFFEPSRARMHSLPFAVGSEPEGE